MEVPEFETYVADTLSSLSTAAMGAVLMSGSENYIEDAQRQLEESLRLDGDNVIAWYLLGRLKAGIYDHAAETCFSTALELDPQFLPAILESVRIRRDLGQVNAALEEFLGLSGSDSPAGELALAEYVILADSLGMESAADSAAATADLRCPGVWERLAREQMFSRPSISLRALGRVDTGPSPDVAWLLLELGDHESAAAMSAELLTAGTRDSTEALLIMGISLYRAQRDGEAREALMEVLEKDPLSVSSMVYLGQIAERAGDTGSAVDRYLMALELDTFNSIARERLREIADDSYDPEAIAGQSRGFSVMAGADMSVERGSRSLLEWGGSAQVSYRFDRRGSSVDGSFGGRSVTWEEKYGVKTDTLNTNRGWASLGFDYWFSDSWYLQAASSWDRQMYTERPWQISSYGALGWQKWILSWFWFSPRIGLGSVNARWTTGMDDFYTDDFSLFAAAGLMYSKPHTFIRRAEIAGELYFPPDDPESFISRGTVSLAFRTWNPLYLTVGYSVDYTRSPEISTWEKFNTSFTTSLNIDLY
jgi:tetratricopeptide (TPR) repeat protein